MKKHYNFCIIIYIIFLLSCAPSVPRYTNQEYLPAQPVEKFNYQQDRLVAEIKKFYGAPYRWGGSTPNGTDCSGMVMTIYKNAFGISLPHNAQQIYLKGTKISKQSLQMGDLVFFSSTGNKATHMGIYIRNNFFVHASVSRGVTLDNLDENPYKYQFMGCVRL